MNEVKLFESKDWLSLKLFEGILKENDIPYNIHSYRILKMELSKAIFVREEDFEKANELLKYFNEQKLVNDEIPEELKQNEEDLIEEEMMKKKYSIPLKISDFLVYIILIIVFICILKIILIDSNMFWKLERKISNENRQRKMLTYDAKIFRD